MSYIFFRRKIQPTPLINVSKHINTSWNSKILWKMWYVAKGTSLRDRWSGLWCFLYYLLAVWPYMNELIKLSEPLFLHQFKKKKAERYLAELQSGLNEIKLINLARAKWELLNRGTEGKTKEGKEEGNLETLRNPGCQRLSLHLKTRSLWAMLSNKSA